MAAVAEILVIMLVREEQGTAQAMRVAVVVGVVESPPAPVAAGAQAGLAVQLTVQEGPTLAVRVGLAWLTPTLVQWLRMAVAAAAVAGPTGLLEDQAGQGAAAMAKKMALLQVGPGL